MSKRDMVELARQLRREGYTVEKTNGQHLVIRHPKSDRAVFAPSTSSDRRALQNVRAKLKRDQRNWAADWVVWG